MEIYFLFFKLQVCDNMTWKNWERAHEGVCILNGAGDLESGVPP